MTHNREFNAATIEEAVRKASEDLDVAPEKLSYEVLDAGSSGFLGMGSRDARIAVESGNSPQEETGERPVNEGLEEPAIGAAKAPRERKEPAPDAPQEERPPISEELRQSIEDFVTTAVEAMGFDARVDVYDAGDVVAVDVASGETGLFIGQKGETIDALQYLLNTAMYKGQPFGKRIVVDSEGYRQRRVEAVQGMAHRMARKAVREERLVELPPMNPAERRIVHVFLKDNPRVTTSSQGSGDNRYVTVFPT
ncbi:MAG: RNA-binding cell elongation regulator Jag/EloR [Rubrobacteraceae bacterium]